MPQKEKLKIQLPSFEKDSDIFKEERINTFLDEMNIEIIAPSEVNHIKLLTGSEKALTPSLKMNCSSLLKKRTNALKLKNSFSEYF
jgi:hypothetical protein